MTLADELEKLLTAYRKQDSTTADAFALRSHMVAHADAILSVLREREAAQTLPTPPLER
jgi:hypothetical protein